MQQCLLYSARWRPHLALTNNTVITCGLCNILYIVHLLCIMYILCIRSEAKVKLNKMLMNIISIRKNIFHYPRVRMMSPSRHSHWSVSTEQSPWHKCFSTVLIGFSFVCWNVLHALSVSKAKICRIYGIHFSDSTIQNNNKSRLTLRNNLQTETRASRNEWWTYLDVSRYLRCVGEIGESTDILVHRHLQLRR